MSDKIYFHLLILCGILSQGIIETIGDEIEKSSGFLNRQKRVVSYVQGEDKTAAIRDIPYVVLIRLNSRINCAGSILSHHVVITISQCVQSVPRQYEVVSGASRSDHGIIHDVINITKHSVSHPSRSKDGIALLTVTTPFVFGAYTHSIELHSGPLLTGTVGIISGWGYNCGDPNPGTRSPRSVRTIKVSVIAHRECVNRYQPYSIEIFDDYVCTFDPQRHCGHSDGGAPLVVDGFLAGIHLWTGPYRLAYNAGYPDVFAILQHSNYHQWIKTNVRDIEAHFQNHPNK